MISFVRLRYRCVLFWNRFDIVVSMTGRTCHISNLEVWSCALGAEFSGLLTAALIRRFTKLLNTVFSLRLRLRIGTRLNLHQLIRLFTVWLAIIHWRIRHERTVYVSTIRRIFPHRISRGKERKIHPHFVARNSTYNKLVVFVLGLHLRITLCKKSILIKHFSSFFR